MKKSKIVILIAAAIAVLGTTVCAAEIFKWNNRAAEVFVADEEQRQKLVTEQIATGEYQTVSDAGLTIQAIQTVQDNSCFYALFEITADDKSLQITPGHDMGLLIDYPGGENPFGYVGYGFVDEREQAVSNSRYYEIYGTKTNPQSTGNEDLNMKLQFTSLNAPGGKATAGEVVLTGNWEFLLNLHATEPVCYELNKEYQIDGCAVTVKSVELTPISVKLTCDEAGARQLEKLEGVNIDQADSLVSLYINGIKYQDGTIVEEEGYQELWVSCENGDYTKAARLTSVIDTDKVSALLVGDANDEIALP